MEVIKGALVSVEIDRFRWNGIIRDIVGAGKKAKYHVYIIGGMSSSILINDVVVSREEIHKPSTEPAIFPPDLTSELLTESADKDDSVSWLRSRLRLRFLPRSRRRR